MDYPFRSEGCSAIQDFDQQECCVRHDWLYWQGGSIQDRARADREFFQCVRRTRSGWLAGFRWLGVRIGGLGILPFYDWRWGYGWEYPRSRAPENDNSPYTVETERPTFEKRLAEAREHDRRMREKGALDPAVELDEYAQKSPGERFRLASFWFKLLLLLGTAALFLLSWEAVLRLVEFFRTRREIFPSQMPPPGLILQTGLPISLRTPIIGAFFAVIVVVTLLAAYGVFFSPRKDRVKHSMEILKLCLSFILGAAAGLLGSG